MNSCRPDYRRFHSDNPTGNASLPGVGATGICREKIQKNERRDTETPRKKMRRINREIASMRGFSRCLSVSAFALLSLGLPGCVIGAPQATDNAAVTALIGDLSADDAAARRQAA